MGYSFNTFFGYENEINRANDLVLIYGFAVIIFGMLGLTMLGGIIRRMGFQSINSFLLSPLILSLGLTLLISILPTIVFYAVASDISGVKILYSWITIFTGMTLFVFLNLPEIKSYFHSFGKVSEREEFRNRRRK
ncbi:hypothetical protein [Flavobacterium hercynium]|uniref:Uncharacterized protein n=1 Tax=Flavobacterium hercynium TaxID=387094 RepID=A0A226H5H0_9FLAO|nr:hypothetical protein [Flavobacterium hercynium]OXA89442.1 hypothetical protein B0A66_14105 [Flavobacterium hercynium]SMP37402.1 hypothetical protein SAMN06265346_1323 [Flavobacterium hercynium]